MFYRPPPMPAAFVGIETFTETWNELVALHQPRRRDATALELATLMLVDLRATGPDWPIERYRELAALLRDIRR